MDGIAMDISVAMERDAAEWDQIIKDSPHGTLFHSWKWLKTIEKHTDSKFYPVIVYQRENPIGVIPLFFQKKMHIKMVFSPPPNIALYYLGPILIDDSNKQLHKREKEYRNFQVTVDHFIQDDLKATYVSISLPPGLIDPRPYQWAGYVINPAYDYVLEISENVKWQWEQIQKKVRQNVIRAENKGIQIIEGDRKDLEILFDLIKRRYWEQRKRIFVPKEYLLDLYDQFPENIRIILATYKEEAIGGVIDVIYKKQLFSWIGNPKPGISISPSPNDLLIWKEIQHSCNNGMRRYTTMSAAGNERLHEYYSSKINPELQIRYNVKKYSLGTRIIESVYSQVLKPINERIYTSFHLDYH